MYLIYKLDYVAEQPKHSQKIDRIRSFTTATVRLEILLFIVNGGWSDWTSFGDCSKTCGGGIKTRQRTCTNPAPANGGKDCKGSSSDSMSCNEQGCPGQ